MIERLPGAEPMTPEIAALVRLAAAMSSPSEAILADAMRGAAEVADRVAAEEVLLQGYLFVGYPAVLRALAMWRRLVGGPAAAVAPAETREDWAERGAQVCARIYGGAYERLRKNVAGLHPDLERWMVEEGYGKVLGRPGLDLKERELCVVALLAGLPASHQLHSHLRGALNAGAAPEEVDAALELAGMFLRPERLAAARRLWDDVYRRWLERMAASLESAQPESLEGRGGV